MSTLKFWNIYKYGDQNHFFLKFLKEEGSMENLSSQRKGRTWLTVLGKNTEESPVYSVPWALECENRSFGILTVLKGTCLREGLT